MIFTNSDGGSRGNPGPGAIGVVVREDEKILEEHGEKLPGTVTNNVAEYNGIIKALELAKKYTKEEITCILDSELVVRQLLGEYKVRHPSMIELYAQVKVLEKNFKKVTYKHVNRTDKFQKMADFLVNKALDEK